MEIINYNPHNHGDKAHELDKKLFPDLESNRNDFETYHGWVLVINNEFAGVILYSKDTNNKKNWSFDLLGIYNKYQGKGFSNKLMEKLTKQADKENVIVKTLAYKGKAELVYLYKKFRFQETGKENYIGSKFMIRYPQTMDIKMDSCSSCGFSNVEFFCDICFQHAYCSEECGLEHWDQHQTDCELIEKRGGGKFVQKMYLKSKDRFPQDESFGEIELRHDF